MAKHMKVVVGAQITASTEQLKKDLERIAPRLKPKVTVGLDYNPTIKKLNSQLQSIFKTLKPKVNITPVFSKPKEIETSSKKGGSSQTQDFSKTAKDIAIITERVEKAEFAFRRLAAHPTHIKDSISKLRAELDILSNANTPEEQSVAWKNLNDTLKLTTAQMETIREQVGIGKDFDRDAKSVDAMTLSIQKLTNSVKKYIEKNTKLQGTDFEKQLKDVIKKIERGFDPTGVDKTKFRSLQAARVEIDRIKKSAEEAGKSGQTMWDRISSAYKKFGGWYLITQSLAAFIRTVKQAVQVVKELDEVFVNLRMVTGGTVQDVNRLLDTYNKMAIRLGATTKEIATAGNEFLRQGLSIEDTNKMIEASTVLSKVGMLSAAEATQYITSAIKGYKLEAKDAMSVVDKLTTVDMHAAISAGGIAEAMAQTATGARLAGIEMDKLIGMLASVAEVTQADPSSVGRAFKTMFARMGSIKLGKLEDEEGESISEYLSDAEHALAKVGIQLRKSKTEFNNFGDVLDQLAGKWGMLNDVERNSIAMAFAATRQKENFLVMMENYSNTMDYASYSANSAGTAMQKMEAYQDGIEASTKKLTAEFERLARAVVKSGAISGVINAMAVALKNIVPILITIAGIVGVINAHLVVDSLGKVVGILGKVPAIFSAIKGFGASLLRLPGAMLIASKHGISLSNTLNAVGISASTAQIAIGALTAVLAIGFMAWQHYKRKQEETIAKHIEAGEAAYDNAQKIRELSERYNELYRITNRTAEQDSEFKSVQDQLLPLLKEKRAVLRDLTEGTEEYAKALNEASEAALGEEYATTAKAKLEAGKKLRTGTVNWAGFYDSFSVRGDYSDLVYDTLSPHFIEHKIVGSIGSEDSLLDYYSDLKVALSQLNEEFNKTGDEAILQSKLYNNISKSIKNLEKNVLGYATAKIKAEQVEYEFRNGAPKTTEEYNKMRNAIIESTGANEEFHGMIDQILGSAFPKFAKGAKDSADAVGSLAETVKSVKLDDFAEKLDKLESMQEKLEKGTNIDYKDIEWISSKYPELLAFIGDEIKLRDALKNKIAEESSEMQIALNNKLFATSQFNKAFYENNKALFDSLGIKYDNDLNKFVVTENQKSLSTKTTVTLIGSEFNVMESVLRGTYEADLANFIAASSAKASQAEIDAAKAQAAWAKVLVEQAKVDQDVLNAPFTNPSANVIEGSVYKGDDGNWYYIDANNVSQWITNKNIISALEAKRNVRMPSTYNPPKTGSDPYRSEKDANAELLKKDRYILINNEIIKTENELLRIKDEREQLDEKDVENAEKINSLYANEILLLKQKQGLLHTLNEARRAERNEIIDDLSRLGFLISGEGDSLSIDNYQQIIDAQLNRVNSLRSSKDKKAYTDASDKLKEMQDIAKRFFDLQLSEIPKTSSEWFKLNKEIVSTLDNIDKTNEYVYDNRLKKSKRYIDDRNFYNDWGADNEVDAWKRVAKYTDEFYEQGLIKKERYEEEKSEIERNIYKASQSRVQQLQSDLDRYTSIATDILNKRMENYDYLIKKEQALANAMQKQYDIQAKIRDIQKDIKIQLASSKIMSDYLDTDTRKLLFNEDDYSTLSKALEKLQSETKSLYYNYIRDINNLTKDNMYLENAITKEYERRLAMKEKEYEITKIQLNLSKKQTELDNILKEKNIRMLIGSEWVNVADTEKVRRATEELISLEEDLSEIRLKSEEQRIIDRKQSEIDMLQQEKAALDYRIKVINDNANEMRKAFEEYLNPVKGIGLLTRELAEVDIPQLGKAVGAFINSMSKSTGISVNVDKYGSGGRVKTIFDPSIMTYREVFVPSYASGTSSAIGGLSITDEKGYEAKLRKLSAGKYTLLNEGDKVLNAQNTKNLMEWAKTSPSLLDKLGSLLAKPNLQLAGSGNTIQGDLIVNNPANFNDFMTQLNNAFKKPMRK